MRKPKIIILAGGSGTRMWPIKTNKLLLPYLGQPFLARVILEVKEALETKPVVVVSPELKIEIGEPVWLSSARVVVQPESKGMGDAILKAASRVKSGPALIINGNDFLRADFVRRFIKAGAQFPGGALPAVRVKRYFPGGYLKVKGDQVLEVVEKPGEGREPSDLVKPVLDYFGRIELLIKVLRELAKKDNLQDDLYERALSKVLKKERFGWIELKEKWSSIKYPWDILKMMGLVFEAGFALSKFQPVLPKGAAVHGPVYFEKGVRVFEGAVIRGPAYIGQGTILGNNCLVRESMIGPGCVVGFQTEITRSWVGEGCWFHSNFFGDSVISDRSSFGVGAVTGNLRLDEKEIMSVVKGRSVSTQRSKLGSIVGAETRLGALVALMPGIKVGSNCVVGPGTIVSRDLEDDKTCFVVQNQKNIPNHSPPVPNRAEFRKRV
ncbi:NTP transferase domain-containing protein [Patescibacteria group bacterium]|nr:NTP transferase domain-containing protein [Patescibacteria group bacterium]